MSKNKVFKAGILVMVLVFGMLNGSCENSPTDNTITYQGIDLEGNVYYLTLPTTAARASDNNAGKFEMKINSNGKSVIKDGTISDISDDGTYTLITTDDSELIVTISDDEISSIVGSLILEDGSIFIVRTFNTIYLRAWPFTYVDPIDGDNQWGENYGSDTSIKLKDIYAGNINDLINGSDEAFEVTISGTIDVKLNNVSLDFQYIAADDNSNWTYVGGSRSIWEGGNTSIGPGDFTLNLELYRNNIDINTLPEGEIILELVEQLQWHSDDPNKGGYNFGSIPEGSEGKIMATIRNLTITPIN